MGSAELLIWKALALYADAIRRRDDAAMFFYHRWLKERLVCPTTEQGE